MRWGLILKNVFLFCWLPTEVKSFFLESLADHGTRTPMLFSQVMIFLDLMLLNSTKHPLCSIKVFLNIKKIYFHSITQKIYGKGINVTALS